MSSRSAVQDKEDKMVSKGARLSVHASLKDCFKNDFHIYYIVMSFELKITQEQPTRLISNLFYAQLDRNIYEGLNYFYQK